MIIRTFPTDDEINGIYDNIPRDRMEYMLTESGLYRQELRLASQPVETIERSKEDAESFAGYYMYTYIPKDLLHGCNGVLILCPEDDAAAFIEKTGWIKLADEKHIALFALSSPDGWKDAKFNLALAKRAADVLIDRKYYSVGKPRVYIAAYKNAAATGERLILSTPDSLSGLALIGTEGCTEEELVKLGERPSKVSWVKMNEVACPVHIFTEKISDKNRAAVNCFIRCNSLEAEPYFRAGSLYYMPDFKQNRNWVDTENCAVVSVFEKEGLTADSEGLTERIWGELGKCCRTLDYLNSSVHPVRSNEEWGTKRRTMTIDGWQRSWEEYIPDEAKRGLTRPLILVLHGGCGTPDQALLSAGWIRVAEERGLFLAVPYGSIRRFMSGTMPHPAWNANGKSATQDDFVFIRELLEDMFQRYPQIDKTRVYVTGHSMGSAMTQQTIIKMPELFAAAASNSGVIRGGFYGGMQAPADKEKYRMPVIIQMGELDRGGGTYEINKDIKNTMEYWISRNNAGNVDDPLVYTSGLMQHKVYQDPDGVPSVHFIMTENKPHCVTYQDSLMYYDEFLCKFSRGEDGTIYYMGHPVK